MFKKLRNKTYLPPIDPQTAEDFQKKHRIKVLSWIGAMLFGLVFWFTFCITVLHSNS
jgi:hypothetical protein